MNVTLLPYRPERDAYRLLGIPPSASTDEVATACRRLSRAFHPDRNGSPRATQEMQVVNVVRTVLTDPSRRREYDRERERWHAAARAPVPARYGPMPVAADATPRRRTGPPAPAARYLRAAWSGMRVTLAELAPPRCLRCRIVTDGEDAFCAACGTPLLTGG